MSSRTKGFSNTCRGDLGELLPEFADLLTVATELNDKKTSFADQDFPKQLVDFLAALCQKSRDCMIQFGRDWGAEDKDIQRLRGLLEGYAALLKDALARPDVTKRIAVDISSQLKHTQARIKDIETEVVERDILKQSVSERVKQPDSDFVPTL